MDGWIKTLRKRMKRKDVAGSREILEDQMSLSPEAKIWLWYIKFEKENGEVELARMIFERFVVCHSNSKAWILYAKFEEENREIVRARNVYERAVDIIVFSEDLLLAFAEFEAEDNQPERARVIYKHLLDGVREERRYDIYKKLFIFERQYGNSEQIDFALAGKRRIEYEKQLSENPHDYDIWFDYLRLEESVGNSKTIRGVYKRAIAITPEREEKRYWQRYIYLWINYALYEELEAKDVERTRQVYRDCRELISHQKFSFGKIWLLAAQFEIRQQNLNAARIILGNAIGRAPQDKIFKKYIEIEWGLRNIERCRILYDKYLQWSPENCSAWIKLLELEISLKETQRARAIFKVAVEGPGLAKPEFLWQIFQEYIKMELRCGNICYCRELYENYLERSRENCCAWIEYAEFERTWCWTERVRDVFEMAVKEPSLDKPELLWEKYIDFERSQREFERTRKLYERVLEKTKHEKVWISYAKFEASAMEDCEGRDLAKGNINEQKKHCIQRARKVFERAINHFRTSAPELKGARARLLEEWFGEENRFGKLGDVSLVKSKRREMAPEAYRRNYENLVRRSPQNCNLWIEYAKFEINLKNTELARDIFERAVEGLDLDKPDLLWEEYIDFEISEGEFDRTRELYERRLDRTKHLKVWISYAKFEASAMKKDGGSWDLAEENILEQKKHCIQCARKVFERGNNHFRTSAPELKGARARLLEEWLNEETSFGKLGDVSLVESKMPNKVKKRRQIVTEDGASEYVDYVDNMFPEETQDSESEDIQTKDFF